MSRDLLDFKLQVPSFQEKKDPEVYIEWEQKVNHIFNCRNYSEENKLKLATLEFIEYDSV